MFDHTSHMPWSSVRTLAAEFQVTCQSAVPDVYTEMQGIADGAGVDILDIVALNCRSEIALGNSQDGCTSLSWKKGGSESSAGGSVGAELGLDEYDQAEFGDCED